MTLRNPDRALRNPDRAALLLSLFLAAIGTTGLFLATTWGGMFAIMAWPAVSAWALAVTYVFNAPEWLGKRTDGSRAAWAWVLYGPYIVFVSVVWALSRFGPERAFDEVHPGIWVGRRPSANELPSHVGMVVDLTCELGPVRLPRDVEYRCLPTLDATGPEATAMRLLVEELVASPKVMLIHCAQGHGRSATIAAAVLIGRGLSSSPEDAERLMQAQRPLVHLRDGQKRRIREVLGTPKVEG